MSKNRISIVILILMCVMLAISGCSAISPTNNDADRSSLSVDKALIGHWISQDSDATNYYISSDNLIKVLKDGATEQMTYTVSETNDNTNEIEIQVTPASGPASANRMKFTADKKSMTETTEALTIVIKSVDFTYVDNKTAP